MTGDTSVVSVASAGSSIAGGVAVLPNTAGNTLVFSLALLAVVAGFVILLSTLITKAYKTFA